MPGPVLPLAFDATISSRFATGTSLQFDVITCSNATAGTTHTLHLVALTLNICAHRRIYRPAQHFMVSRRQRLKELSSSFIIQSCHVDFRCKFLKTPSLLPVLHSHQTQASNSNSDHEQNSSYDARILNIDLVN
jgi:hypothetical protein